jgi:hypothetical protein
LINVGASEVLRDERCGIVSREAVVEVLCLSLCSAARQSLSLTTGDECKAVSDRSMRSVYRSLLQSLSYPTLGQLLSYEAFEVSAYSDTWPSSLTIAVPSRLYFTKAGKLPFAGMRVAVKDSHDLSSIRTRASSRAFTKLYGPRDKTAASIQNFLNLGPL